MMLIWGEAMLQESWICVAEGIRLQGLLVLPSSE